MRLKILYIDDERVNLSNFQLTFADEFEVATFLGPKEALTWLESNQDVAIVIADQRMGEITGLQLLEKIAGLYPKAIRILVNSYVMTNEIDAAVERGLVLRCIQKPWHPDDFVFTIRVARDNYILARQNEKLQQELLRARSEALAARETFEQRLRESVAVVLQESQSQAKKLSGLLPICASCKKIRDEKGAWNHVEVYIERHSGVRFSHGICPECVGQVYPEVSLARQGAALVQSGKG
ncbi:MAG: response regulator [Desulfobulbaceae bacterium]|nr:response regulator [Desulfobulbaceae bacterium]